MEMPPCNMTGRLKSKAQDWKPVPATSSSSWVAAGRGRAECAAARRMSIVLLRSASRSANGPSLSIALPAARTRRLSKPWPRLGYGFRICSMAQLVRSWPSHGRRSPIAMLSGFGSRHLPWPGAPPSTISRPEVSAYRRQSCASIHACHWGQRVLSGFCRRWWRPSAMMPAYWRCTGPSSILASTAWHHLPSPNARWAAPVLAQFVSQIRMEDASASQKETKRLSQRCSCLIFPAGRHSVMNALDWSQSRTRCGNSISLSTTMRAEDLPKSELARRMPAKVGGLLPDGQSEPGTTGTMYSCARSELRHEKRPLQVKFHGSEHGAAIKVVEKLPRTVLKNLHFGKG